MARAQTPEPMTADAASRLVEFARSCKAAIRIVSMYPPSHPNIQSALERMTAAGAAATSHGPMVLGVMPDGLMMDGRTPAEARCLGQRAGGTAPRPSHRRADAAGAADCWRLAHAAVAARHLAGRDPARGRHHAGVAVRRWRAGRDPGDRLRRSAERTPRRRRQQLGPAHRQLPDGRLTQRARRESPGIAAGDRRAIPRGWASS